MQGVYLTTTAGRERGRPDRPPPAPLPLATLLTFPLFHVGGLQSFLLPYTAAGGKIVLMYKWDAGEAVEHHRARSASPTVAGVPTTMFQLLEAAKAKGATLESLDRHLVGRDARAARARAPHRRADVSRAPRRATATASPRRPARRSPTSARRTSPIPRASASRSRRSSRCASSTADGNDGAGRRGRRDLAEGTDRSCAATSASSDETAEAFTDGWFHTGDLGRLDDDGNLYVVDRLKDVIIRGGENIYAAEVEAALYEHPDITEAAIIGVPDGRFGEAARPSSPRGTRPPRRRRRADGRCRPAGRSSSARASGGS